MGAGKVITDGLIFYVDASNNKSYPGSGTIVTNLGLNTSTASLVNGVSYNSSYGGSFVFDGTNDYISCGDANFRIPTVNFSLETVFYFDGLDKTNAFIFGKRNNNIYYEQMTLSISNGDIYNGGTGKRLTVFLRPDESAGNNNRDRGASYLLPSAGIYHSTFVNDSTSLRLWVNGILVSSGSSSILPVSYNVTGWDTRIGNATNLSTYFTGSIQFVKIYNRALSTDEVLQNYESTRERFNLRGIAIDPDASLFLRTVGITDTTQQSAIDTLVLEMKNAGIWSKMKAIYPFVGGTASTHRWNLKDPRDLDAAYRLTFFGGWTHSSTGADPNGTTGYANTFLTPTTHLTENTTHLSYYSRENTSGAHVEIGSWGDPNRMGISCKYNNFNVSDHYNYNTNRVIQTGLNGDGYYVATRTSSTVHKLFRNSTQVSTTNTSVSSGWSSVTRTVVLAYNNQISSDYSNKECAFATIGDGLTDADVANLYTIVQKYQTTLGRQV
jgi:hypothetical protein